MRATAKVDTLIRIGFVVLNPDTDAGVEGLETADFTRYLSFDGTDVPNGTLDMSIVEIGDGRYEAQFTPDAVGYWMAWLTHSTYNIRGWLGSFDVTTNGIMTAEDILNGILDVASAVEGASLRQFFRGLYSVFLATSSGHGTNAPVYRDGADTKNRIVATLDNDGNRTSVTLDLD
jgi:hypothetical protein